VGLRRSPYALSSKRELEESVKSRTLGLVLEEGLKRRPDLGVGLSLSPQVLP
jgi:hypothetical protein